MRRVTAILSIAALVTGAGFIAPVVLADQGHAGHKKRTAPVRPDGRTTEITLRDLELRDQDGRTVRFKSDVVGDRLVVIDTIYTTCGLICPLLSALFANLQQQLGPRLSEDVILISISVDPVTDIPTRLKDYAIRYGAKPGWIFLTGDKQHVDDVLRGLGVYTADYTEHPSMILVGDARRNTWTRFFDFPAPKLILGRLEELRADRLARTGKP